MSEAQETTEVVEEVSQEPTAEDIAREHGWRPKDEWDGDPDLWVNAAQFNELEMWKIKLRSFTR